MNLAKNLPAICSALALWVSQGSAYANPITLGFDAEIATLVNHDNIDLGIQVAVGDRISGRFTFEPDRGGHSGTNVIEFQQWFSSSLEIDGQSLMASEVHLTSFNNSLVVCDCPAGVPDPSGLFDVLKVSSGGPGSITSTLPSIDPELSYWRIELWGRQPLAVMNPDGTYSFPALLEQPELPNDVSRWNAFRSQRTLAINLRDRSGDGVYIQANVNDFVAVPEPSTPVLTIFATVCVSLLQRQAARLC